MALLESSFLRLFESVTLIFRALEIKQTLLGQNHPDVAIAFSNLSNLALNRDDFENAELNIRKALNIYQVSACFTSLTWYSVVGRSLSSLLGLFTGGER